MGCDSPSTVASSRLRISRLWLWLWLWLHHRLRGHAARANACLTRRSHVLTQLSRVHQLQAVASVAFITVQTFALVHARPCVDAHRVHIAQIPLGVLAWIAFAEPSCLRQVLGEPQVEAARSRCGIGAERPWSAEGNDEVVGSGACVGLPWPATGWLLIEVHLSC